MASLVSTLPLAEHPTRTLPSDLLDTLLTTWIISWDASRLPHALQGVWNPPIYFPYPRTLAFSENLFGVALPVAPVYWITGNPVLTYNVAFLLTFTLAGTGMYLLARDLTGSRAAAAISGAYYAFCPFRMAQSQLAHIQMLAIGWLPITLWSMHRYFLSFRRRWLALFAAACCLQVLSNTYVAYFMTVPIGIVTVYLAWTSRGQIRRWSLDLAVTLVMIVAVLVPVALQYYQVRVENQQIRSAGEIESGGADLRAYFVPDSGLWRRWLPLPKPIFGETEKELFPGIAGPALAVVALSAAAFRRRRISRWAIVYAAIAVAGFLLSLGPLVRVWGVVLTRHGPYDWLQHVLPGMGGMRAPSRFVVIAILGLSVLAAYGASLVVKRVPPRMRAFIIALLLAGVIADGWAVPIPTVAYEPRGRLEDRAIVEWLRAMPTGPVLHLPLMTAQFQELHYQYATLFHGHPMINGFTGWASPLQELLRHPRSPIYDYDRYPATVAMLRSLGVRYVFVHPGDYNITQLANGELKETINGFRRSGQLAGEKRLLDVYAFELMPFPRTETADALTPIRAGQFQVDVSQQKGRAEFLVDGDNDSRWIGSQDGSSVITAQFAAPRDVARVELQLAQRSLMEYPRDLQIDAEDRDGRSRTLYRGSPYPEFFEGFLRDRSYPSIRIDLPHNETVALHVREIASYDSWWSVHELRLWQRP
jgi:dolichyl-phosphate-mannose-protein mannosyltransferase